MEDCEKNRNDRENDCGSVVLSIDFEMRWGVYDVYGLNQDAYRQNLENCRPVVLATLEMLSERDLKATWATVGALGMDDWNDYFSFAPPPPTYENSKLAFQKAFADLDPDGILHFAPDLVRKIVETKGQELGSHSFSHLHFREAGMTSADFLADINAVEKLWRERFGVVPVSLVYPRNQSTFTDQLDKTSIKVWRGPESPWFYDCTSRRANTILPRVLRLVDSINPWVKRASQAEPGMVRASLFVRFGLPESLWRLQLRRVKNELNRLGPNDIFHCWWHPHNLGFDLNVGKSRLAQILDLVAEYCGKKKVVSLKMQDFLTIENFC